MDIENPEITKFEKLVQRSPVRAFMAFLEKKDSEPANIAIAMGQIGLARTAGRNQACNAFAFSFFKHTMEIVKKQAEFIGLQPETRVVALDMLDNAEYLARRWGTVDKNAAASVRSSAAQCKADLGL